ncbi:MAG: hypothetical protein EU547_03115 [Promethearchaeota archaeon]|nr:MAG: hypothetical protein EU547_03115 [Candidatus Lokiarchaeota archaeon]
MEYTKLKLLGEITITKEKLHLFENKYDCTLEEFRTRIKKSEEEFEEWEIISNGRPVQNDYKT